MSTSLAICDPHFHLIDVTQNPYPWLEPEAIRPDIFAGKDQHLRHVFRAEDYATYMRDNHVIAAVHVQANWDPSDPVGETRWLTAIHARHGIPTGLVGYANLASDDLDAVLDGHLTSKLTRGVRHILNWHSDPKLRFTDRGDYLTDPVWRQGCRALVERGLSLDTQIFPQQFDELLEVARFNPDLQIIVNHAGMPIDRSAEGLEYWIAGMRRLASAPNVAMKISGLGLGQYEWEYDAARTVALSVIEVFGLERSMFASNHPVEGIWVSFGQMYDDFKRMIADLTHEEQQRLLADNALRIYQLSNTIDVGISGDEGETNSRGAS